MSNSVVGKLFCVLLSLLVSTRSDYVFGSESSRIEQIEYQLKASFLYNFLQFISFPAEALENENTITVCVLGENRFGGAIDELQGAATPQGKIDVDILGSYSPNISFKGCNVLFIVKNEAPHAARVLAEIDTEKTITVSEYAQFLNQGGIIEFYVKDDSIHFRINVDQAQKAKYQVAAQLIELGVNQ